MIRTTKSINPEPLHSPSAAEPRPLTVKDVAERLQMSERTVHRLIDARELDIIRIGRSVRVSAEALMALLTRGDKP